MSAKRKVKPGHEKIFLIGGPGNGKTVQVPLECRGPFHWNDNGRTSFYTRRTVRTDGETWILWGFERLTDDTVADFYFGGRPYTHNKPAYVAKPILTQED